MNKIYKAVAEPCAPITLTLLESTIALAMIDWVLPTFADDAEVEGPAQSVRDKIYLAIPEDLRDALPGETP